MTDREREVHASELDCIECGAEAEVFWPVVDPDIPSSPYCRTCVERAKHNLMVKLFVEADDA